MSHSWLDALVQCNNCHSLAFVMKYLQSVHFLWLHAFRTVRLVVVQTMTLVRPLSLGCIWSVVLASMIYRSFHCLWREKWDEKNKRVSYILWEMIDSSERRRAATRRVGKRKRTNLYRRNKLKTRKSHQITANLHWTYAIKSHTVPQITHKLVGYF